MDDLAVGSRQLVYGIEHVRNTVFRSGALRAAPRHVGNRMHRDAGNSKKCTRVGIENVAGT